jgi:amidase
MCRSTRDIALFNNAVLTTKPFLDDPSLYATPWNGLASLPLGRKLKVGIMVHDDVVLPQPPILRALALAKEKLLKRHDVEVVEYKAFDHERGYDLTVRLLSKSRTRT